MHLEFDQHFLTELQAGSEPAFRSLVESYQNRVYNTCFGFVRHQAEAEDLAQEVFVEIHQKISSLKQAESLPAWVYRICVNKSLEYIRYQKRKKRFAFLQPIFGDKERPDVEPGHWEHPGFQLEEKEKAAVLFTAIESLPEKQRVAFSLHKLEGLPYQEIAEVMEGSLASIESLIFRARRNLRKKLMDYYRSQAED
ncbi:MAG: RNA polymerase sigma factor [Bacteroidota bacterium]